MPIFRKNPLNYPVNKVDPIRRFTFRRAPLLSDFKQFIIGDEWLDETSNIWYKLTYKDSTQGIWAAMTGTAFVTESLVGDDANVVGPDGFGNINVVGGVGVATTGNPGTNTLTIALSGGGVAIDTLTGNIGGAVPPNAIGNLNIVGGAGIQTTGNPGLNTVTIALTGGGAAIDSITGDTGGAVNPAVGGNMNFLGDSGLYINGMHFTGDAANNTITAMDLRNITIYVVDAVALQTEYQTIQTALDAANAAGGGVVWVRPGTYVEDLVLYDNVDLIAAVASPAGGRTIIDGTHTPPNTGAVTIRNFQLQDAANILNSVAGGDATIVLIDCLMNITNGISINLPNWQGLIGVINCHCQGTDDGFIDIAAGFGTFLCLGSTIGAGSNNIASVAGTTRINSTNIQCHFDTSQQGLTNIRDCQISETMLMSNSSTVYVTDSFFITGNTEAMNVTTDNMVYLNHVTIDSVMDPCIIGTGNIEFGSVLFVNSSGIIATITQYAAEYQVTGPIEIIPSDSSDVTEDAWIKYNIPGVMGYSTGIDNSDLDKWKMTDGIDPSNGNEIITVDPTNANAITFNAAYEFPTADGAAGQVLKTDGAGIVGWGSSGGTGEVIQYVQASTSAVVDCSGVIPYDDTIPQIAEGTQVITVTITPTSATNILVIKSNLFGTNQGGSVGMALFQDATNNALTATASKEVISAVTYNMSLSYRMISGTTLATTFRIRCGIDIAGNHFYVNGTNTGVRLYGGVANTTIEVWEIGV